MADIFFKAQWFVPLSYPPKTVYVFYDKHSAYNRNKPQRGLEQMITMQPLQLLVYTATATHWNMSLTGMVLQRTDSDQCSDSVRVNNLRVPQPLPWLWPPQMSTKHSEILAKILWAISKCHFCLESCSSKFEKFQMPSCYIQNSSIFDLIIFPFNSCISDRLTRLKTVGKILL